MTPTNPPKQTISLTQSQAEANTAFSNITKTVTSIVDSPPIDYYTTINFIPFPLKLTGPRYGVIEQKDEKNQFSLELSQDLLTQYSKYLDSILWREAYLTHLPYFIRQVPEAADLGLYCYYRYALRTKKQRNQFLQIWQTISPSIDYTFYRYYPTAGFEYFDNLVDGKFLKMVKDWFKPFIKLSTPMNTGTYSENLERWMFNYHRLLRPIELKILRGLNHCLTCSQIELAKKLKLRQPTISQVIRRLAEKHLLRLIIFDNYPILGLQPITIQFTTSKMSIINSLMKLISRIRFALAIQEFDNQLLASFLIPTERMTRFRQWLKQIASSYNLMQPILRLISERVHARNFDQYNPNNGGWLIEIESMFDNFSRLISEEWTQHLPPINSFKMSSSHRKKDIKIRQQDLIYMQRASDAFLATYHMKFFESHELRQAGYRESEHMAYRRRVSYLEKHKVISPPIGLGLLNIGLNTALYVHLESSKEETHRIFSACQLFPHIAGRIFEDGTGVATLLIPSETAVFFKKSLDDLFRNLDIHAKTAIKPAWEAYGWTGPYTIDSINYDFEKNRWIWTKDTLPLPRTV